MRFIDSKSISKLQKKICLLRVDLNIEENEKKDNFRILSIIPTIKILIKNKNKIVIISHRGRPEINLNPPAGGQISKFSLRPFSILLTKLLERKIIFIPHFDFNKIKEQIQNSPQGSIFLLENIRLLIGEEENSDALGKQLASLGDFYINDAFAVSHRSNASIVAITKYLPSYAGLLLQKEIKNLDDAMKKIKHPFTIIIGGAKISDKIGVLEYFKNKADYFLLGGGTANTFLLAKGEDVGDSLIDEKSIDFAKKFLTVKGLRLPIDTRIENKKILDIGPKTEKEYTEIIQKSQMIIWSGPMGLFEKKRLGTKSVWRAILSVSKLNKNTKIIIGGGETIASLKIQNTKYKILDSVFLSTGGGAMLEYLSAKKLPGIEALNLNSKSLKPNA